MRRSGGSPALRDQAGLNLDRAAHRVDRAAELDDCAVAMALDDAAVMGGDGRVDQIAAKTPTARKRPVVVGAGEPAVADRNGSTLIHLLREERPLLGAFLPFPDRAGKAAKGRGRSVTDRTAIVAEGGLRTSSANGAHDRKQTSHSDNRPQESGSPTGSALCLRRPADRRVTFKFCRNGNDRARQDSRDDERRTARVRLGASSARSLNTVARTTREGLRREPKDNHLGGISPCRRECPPALTAPSTTYRRARISDCGTAAANSAASFAEITFAN
jgi:hypothetical protein